MKINVGLQRNKKSRFDFTHDVNTTSDIGFVQPLVKQLCMGDSKISVNIGTFCRLNPIVAPSFGQYIIKHTACFVPMDDIYMPYANLISGTYFNGAGDTYIPYNVPFISQNFLFGFILNNCKFSVFSKSGEIAPGKYSLSPVVSSPDVGPAVDFINSRYGSSVVFNQFITNVDDMFWPEGGDFIINHGQNLIVVKMRKRAKNLFKILTGLGYSVTPDSGNSLPLNFLPILAYYKAWFDTYAPKLEMNWQGTTAYNLIKYMEYNQARVNIPVNWDTAHKDLLFNFMFDLSDCYYVCDPDWFTAHIDTTAKGGSVSLGVVGADGSAGEVTATANQTPDYSSNSDNPVMQKALQRLLTYINSNTILGKSITKYFQIHDLGGVDDNKLSSVIESFNQSVNIDDIYASSDYEGQHLGDFAGRATSSSNTGKIVKEIKRPGYFIVLTCVIPRTGYYQGIDYDLLCKQKFDFYTPEFDSLGFEASPKQLYIGGSDVKVSNTDHGYHNTFGFIPRYAGFKYKNNKVNGDFRVRSLRSALMPYYLDRHVNLAEIIPEGGDETELSRNYFIQETETIPQVSVGLRYLGNSETFGNFDRIFYDSGNVNVAFDSQDSLDDVPLEDNFMLHNIVHFDYFAPMLPMKDSFDTDAFSDSVAVEKQ